MHSIKSWRGFSTVAKFGNAFQIHCQAQKNFWSWLPLDGSWIVFNHCTFRGSKHQPFSEFKRSHQRISVANKVHFSGFPRRHKQIHIFRSVAIFSTNLSSFASCRRISSSQCIHDSRNSGGISCSRDVGRCTTSFWYCVAFMLLCRLHRGLWRIFNRENVWQDIAANTR